MIKSIPGIDNVTLTTNGILLGEQMQDLADAGKMCISDSGDIRA